MHVYDAGRWLLLATLWSIQFIFMRVSVPVFGSGIVAESRALFAGVFLIPWVILFARQPIGLFAHWRDHLSLAMVNNVLPFACFAWAASVLPAGYLAIINGTVPLFAAVIASFVLHERLGARRAAGFLLGIAGIALIVNLGPVTLDLHTALATLSGLTACMFWGWAGVMVKQQTGRLPPMGLAAGSVAWAAVILSPTWLQAPPLPAWTAEATFALVALGVLCSGLAYLPFFTLIRDIGASRTMAVAFMIPVLGVVWGWLLLGEPVTPSMVAGGALVLVSMALVLRK